MEKSQNFFFRQAATICYAFLIFCPFFGLFITYPPFISPLFLRKFRAKNEIMRQKAALKSKYDSKKPKNKKIFLHFTKAPQVFVFYSRILAEVKNAPPGCGGGKVNYFSFFRSTPGSWLPRPAKFCLSRLTAARQPIKARGQGSLSFAAFSARRRFPRDCLLPQSRRRP